MSNIDEIVAAHRAYCQNMLGMPWTRLYDGEYEAIIAAARPQEVVEAAREVVEAWDEWQADTAFEDPYTRLKAAVEALRALEEQ
jgi:hypothetical protein